MSGDEVEAGPVSSEPSKRGAIGIVPLALVSEPAGDPTLVQVQGVVM